LVKSKREQKPCSNGVLKTLYLHAYFGVDLSNYAVFGGDLSKTHSSGGGLITGFLIMPFLKEKDILPLLCRFKRKKGIGTAFGGDFDRFNAIRAIWCFLGTI
jgi:hypothetical protein